MKAQEERTRRKRGSLTDEEILNAAENVAASSEDAITMRAVAARLGASPMALYRYFPTKEDLVDSLVDRVLQRVPVPIAGDWEQRLRQLSLAHGRVLADHPWAIGPLFASPSPGIGAARLGESFLAILAEGGLKGHDGVAAFTAVLALNYGRTAFGVTAIDDELPPLPAEHFPHSAASAAALASYASQGNYEGALDLLLAGIGARGRAGEAGPAAAAGPAS